MMIGLAIALAASSAAARADTPSDTAFVQKAQAISWGNMHWPCWPARTMQAPPLSRWHPM